MDDLRHPSPPISSDNIPDIIPILPIVDTNLFPKMVLPLVLIQNEAVELIDEAMSGNRMLGLLLSKRSDVDSRHTSDDLHRIGTVAIILKMSKMEDDKAQLLIQGLNRFRVVEFLRGFLALINIPEINLTLNLPVIQNLPLIIFSSAEPYFKYCDKVRVKVHNDIVTP